MTNLKKETLHCNCNFHCHRSKCISNCSKFRLTWMYNQTFPEQNKDLKELDKWHLLNTDSSLGSTFPLPSSEELQFSIAITQGAKSPHLLKCRLNSRSIFDGVRSTFPSSEEVQGHRIKLLNLLKWRLKDQLKWSCSQ